MKTTAYNYQNGNVTLCLMRKQRNKDEKIASTYWRVTYNQQRKYIASGFSFEAKDWTDFVNRKLLKHKDIKTALELFLKKTLVPAIDRLVGTGTFSFDSLLKEVGRGNKESVNDAFRARIKELKSIHSIGNASIYKGVFNALKIFGGYRKLRGSDKRQTYMREYLEKKYIRRGDNVFSIPDVEVVFSEITPKFLKDWETFLREIETSVAYIGINMRTLRAIINNEGGKAYLSGDNYPFGKGKYIIPTGRRRKTYLPIEEIWKMEDCEINNPALIYGRDMYLFMFYGSGMNIGDVFRLRYENVKRNELVFFREKTATTSSDEPTPVHVPLLAPMIQIINSHGNKDQSGYIFPLLNGITPEKRNEERIKEVINGETRRINESLKTIANELELDEDLSTNYARHSYMTHLLSELYLNDIIVKQMVGHSVNDNVTAGYNHLTAKKRREINSNLLNPEKNYSTVIKATKYLI